MTNTNNQGATPWRRWLPHTVVFLKDDRARVRALRALRHDAPAVDLALGAVMVRVKPDTPRRGLTEWSVFASAQRHADEARATLGLIQHTLVSLEELQPALARAIRANRPVPRARRRALLERERGILGWVAAAFLLVDPLSHPELAQLYHPKIIRLITSLPDLRGRLNLSAPPPSS